MKMKITYQGVAGAYSNIAAMQVFPEQDYLPCDTFEEAMGKVSAGEADLAMIPVENSNAGRVSDVHFLLPKTGLHIVGEHFPAAGAAWRPPGRYSGRVVASAGFGAVFRVFESARN